MKTGSETEGNSPVPTKRSLKKRIGRVARNLLLFFFFSTIAMVVIYRFVPVYVTPLMFIRSVQQMTSGKELVWKHKWVPLEEISPHLPMAVIASEDNRFAEHHGFDFEEIEKAMKENSTRKKHRGASTISQQTAKNVFLWPQSSWVRKGFEVYFTTLIELLWSKERIMEVYLNSIEMGYGLYGAEVTAKYHFHTTAKKLTRGECALIAASLPNPIRLHSGKPSAYMLKRQKKILYLMNCVPKFPPVEKSAPATKKKKSSKKCGVSHIFRTKAHIRSCFLLTRESERQPIAKYKETLKPAPCKSSFRNYVSYPLSHS